MAPLISLLRRWRCDRGAELVEFALVLPLLLLLVMGIIEFGIAFQRYEVVTNAAREGARIAVLPGYAQADVEARVNAYLTLSGLNQTPTVEYSAPESVDIGGVCMTVSGVSVSYPHTFSFLGSVAPLVGGNYSSITLTSTSKMRYEGAALGC